MKVRALLACHSRREKTLVALQTLSKSASRAGLDLSITLFDDGSMDGTAASVHQAFPSARVLEGDGNAFWARAMSLAEAAAVSEDNIAEDDVLLWLNDDVQLDADAIERLSSCAVDNPGSALIGATRDSTTGAVTYAGHRRTGWHPLKFVRVEPSDTPVAVEAFNGNIVWVPYALSSEIGPIDGGYSHALADLDYGLRLARAGKPALLLPSTFGTCSNNQVARRRGLVTDWRAFIGPKGGGNYASVRRFVRKFEPSKWPWALLVTYGAWWVRRLAPQVSPKRVRSAARMSVVSDTRGDIDG